MILHILEDTKFYKLFESDLTPGQKKGFEQIKKKYPDGEFEFWYIPVMNYGYTTYCFIRSDNGSVFNIEEITSYDCIENF